MIGFLKKAASSVVEVLAPTNHNRREELQHHWRLAVTALESQEQLPDPLALANRALPHLKQIADIAKAEDEVWLLQLGISLS